MAGNMAGAYNKSSAQGALLRRPYRALSLTHVEESRNKRKNQAGGR